jgi:hypothetical protein
MAKGKPQKDKQYNGQRKTTKAIILFVLLSFSFGHYIVCPFVVFLWPLYCLSFCLPKENDQRTNNIKAKGKRQKDKQYNGQRKTTKGQTI